MNKKGSLVDKSFEKRKTRRKWVDELLDKAIAHRFYGTIEIKMEGGVVIRAHTRETLVPPGEE